VNGHAHHFGRFAELTEAQQTQALMATTLTSALRAIKRREELGIADGAYWPTCAVMVSIPEAQALLAAVPEKRWPESTRALRRELQAIVREGERTRP
jgi:hypothetical protein